MRAAIWLSLVLAGWFLSGCATVEERTAQVRGTVTYRQRLAMPLNASVEVRLVDVTGGADPAPVVAETTFRPAGQVPVAYVLSYPVSALQSGRQYAVQARILVDGRPWMVTATVNHVMDWGRIARADVVLQPAR